MVYSGVVSILLGALYVNRGLEEVRQSWRGRLTRVGEPRLELNVRRDGADRVRLTVTSRKGRQVPHRRMGSLVRAALGPEREELAEFWLLEPGDAEPGDLRLAGASWEDCLSSISQPNVRQVRLWSPMVCPGGLRERIEARGWEMGLEMRIADCWTVLAIPHPKPHQQFPAPWKGNYGW